MLEQVKKWSKCLGIAPILSALLLFPVLAPAIASKPLPAKAEDNNGSAWRETSLAGCTSQVWLSKYQNGILFCAGDNNFRAINLLTNSNKVLSNLAINLFYEDEATGVLIGTLTNASSSPAYRSVDGGVNWQPTNWLYFYSDIVPETYGSSTYYGIEHVSSSPLHQIVKKSTDSGLNWEELKFNNGASGNGGIAVHPGNPKILYATGNFTSKGDARNGSAFATLYKSEDGGLNWKPEQKLSVNFKADKAFVVIPNSRLASEDAVQVIFKQEGTGTLQKAAVTYFLSLDQGNSFITQFFQSSTGTVVGGNLVQGYEGTLYVTRQYYCDKQCKLVKGPLVFSDGDEGLQPLSLSDAEDIYTSPQTPLVVYAAARPLNPDPAKELPVAQTTSYYRSTNQGKTWTKLPDTPVEIQIPCPMLVSDYLPLRLVLICQGIAFHYNDTEAEKTETKPFSSTYNGEFYEKTGHNLSGVFQPFWEKNGGLALFGYPKTEVFRELNSSDGNIYPVQYFERNRFEWHVSYAGTPFEVLLGLLGNQFTEKRRLKGEPPFNPVQNANYPGGSFFSETGHNLRGSFKAYWEANGGLAIYGYPISEEFSEVNPDTGKTYTVQYFERNRFEYHSENRGTGFDILLGLLGNSILKQKGWL